MVSTYGHMHILHCKFDLIYNCVSFLTTDIFSYSFCPETLILKSHFAKVNNILLIIFYFFLHTQSTQAF